MKIEDNICYFEEVNSTNDEAKKLAYAGAKAGTAVVAYSQKKGRGRDGRKWYSSANEALYFSMVIRPKGEPEELKEYVRRAAEVTVKAVKEKLNVEIGIEWPNDLILDERKVGGILLESVTQGQKVAFLILGLGLNLNQEKFPDDLKASAISLYQKTGKKYDIKKIARVIREAMVKEFC